MAGFSFLLCAALLRAAGGASGHRDKAVGHDARSSLRISAQVSEALQKLMICNAYTSPKPLDVLLVRTSKRLTDGNQLSYKSCQTFDLNIQEGEQLDFLLGDDKVGTFRCTGLPSSASSLLLVPHRRKTGSMASFDSHAFSPLVSAQVAVMDAYQGSQVGRIKIMDRTGIYNASGREEDLRFNSVMALNPGSYEVALFDGAEQKLMSVPLEVNGEASYVVLRVGLQQKANSSRFVDLGDQELIVAVDRPPVPGTVLLQSSTPAPQLDSLWDTLGRSLGTLLGW